MNTSVSASCFISAQAAILCLCMGLFLVGFAVAAHAAQPEAALFSTRPDLLTIRLEQYDGMRLAAYRFDTRVGIADTADNIPGASRFGGTSGVIGYIKQLKLPDWVASIGWHLAADSDRASLAPYLRVESKETLIVIKPLEHSALMVWHMKID
jgi:hypothetical protein